MPGHLSRIGKDGRRRRSPSRFAMDEVVDWMATPASDQWDRTVVVIDRLASDEDCARRNP
jgi:hypothetical protein